MDPSMIKRLLKETGRTQRDLAAHLDVDPAAVTRMLAGKRRLRLDEAPKVEAFFGLPPAATANVLLRPTGGERDPDGAPRDLPVFGSAQGGPDGMRLDYEPVEWMRRPQALEGVVDAFAFYVVGDSMEPRFRHGERLLVHPKRPPRPGEDVLLILRDEAPEAAGSERSAMVKTLVRRAPHAVTVSQYNPPRQFDIPAENVDGVLLIVGSFFHG